MNENQRRGLEYGRLKRYPTAESLRTAVEAYFEACDKKTFERFRGVHESTPYTVEGLSRSLGLDRTTLNDYEKLHEDPESRKVVRDAKLRIQQDVLERGLSGRSNPAVTIFNLKNNFGYADKTETDSTVQVVGITGMKISSE